MEQLLRTLQHSFRRDAIEMLMERPGEVVHVDHVVDHLAQENEVAARLDRERLVTEVYHNHLPKLAEHHFVEFDRQSGDCRYHPDEVLERFLAVVQELEFE